MAITATSRIIYDGQRHCTMQFTGIGDGGGDETNVLKVDVSAFSPPCVSVAIKRISYDVSYGVLEMLWDAMTPVTFAMLEGGDEIDYCRINGLTNGGGVTATGNILFSTRGFELNSNYTVVLEMRKKDKL